MSELYQNVPLTLPEDLLARVDQAVAERGDNRSVLARQAFEDLLFRLWVEKMEQQDAAGYERRPQDLEELEDIDLAVGGIKDEDFWRADVALERLDRTFEFDLIAIESASPGLLAEIEQRVEL